MVAFNLGVCQFNWIEWMNEYCHSFVWLCHSLRVNGVYFISVSRFWFEHNGIMATAAASNNTHKAVLFISEQWSIKCSIEMLMRTCLKCTQICVHWLHLCKLEWNFESYCWKCSNEMPFSWCTREECLFFSSTHTIEHMHMSYVLLQLILLLCTFKYTAYTRLISCQMQRCVKEKSAPDPFNHLTYYIHAHHVNMFRRSPVCVLTFVLCQKFAFPLEIVCGSRIHTVAVGIYYCGVFCV